MGEEKVQGILPGLAPKGGEGRPPIVGPLRSRAGTKGVILIGGAAGKEGQGMRQGG